MVILVIPVLKETLDHRDQLEPKVTMVIQEILAHKVILAH